MNMRRCASTFMMRNSVFCKASRLFAWLQAKQAATLIEIKELDLSALMYEPAPADRSDDAGDRAMSLELGCC